MVALELVRRGIAVHVSAYSFARALAPYLVAEECLSVVSQAGLDEDL